MAKGEVERTERLLALLLLQGMKSAPQREKVLQLNLAGFSNVEIADLLGITGAGVSQALYEARKPTRRKPRAAS
jgi:DNA-directed RNA polymerase specialized sigma24 family protein